MGTKVGNNPGIFLRAPALLLLFPVISPPTPGWRGFLRSLPADVLWPGFPCQLRFILFGRIPEVGFCRAYMGGVMDGELS